MSLFLLIFSVAVAIGAYRIGLGTLHTPGSGFMFFGASILLGLLSLHLVLKSLWARGATEKMIEDRKHWTRVMIVFIALTAYIFLFDQMGYLLATFFLMVILFRVMGNKNWISILGGSALTSFVTYLVFSVLFSQFFPKGLIRIF